IKYLIRYTCRVFMHCSLPIRLTIFLFTAGFCLHAQDQPKLDSLMLQYERADADTIKIEALIELSKYYLANNYSISARYAQQAIDLAVKKGFKDLEAKGNRALGLTLFSMGDYKSATASYLRSLRFYEEQKDTSGIMAITNNLGVVHDRLKDYDQALVYYFKVQELYNHKKPVQANPFPLPTLYNNIANIYQTKGDFNSALQYYEKSLALAEEAGNKIVQGVALNNIGKLYFIDLKQPDQALD